MKNTGGTRLPDREHKKSRSFLAPAHIFRQAHLHLFDLRSLRPFGALLFHETDPLALAKGFESR